MARRNGTSLSRLAVAALAVLALGAGAPPARAQEAPPFLLLNQDRILTASRTGQALLAEEEAARDALRAEAREIEQRFEAEERALTARRAELPPEEFRALADAFDVRVVEARRDQDARSNALATEIEQRRRQFYAEVGPILVGQLSHYGAHAILEESSVLLADQSLNITDAVIAEIDARAGTDQPPAARPEPQAAEPQAVEPQAVAPRPEPQAVED